MRLKQKRRVLQVLHFKCPSGRHGQALDIWSLSMKGKSTFLVVMSRTLHDQCSGPSTHCNINGDLLTAPLLMNVHNIWHRNNKYDSKAAQVKNTVSSWKSWWHSPPVSPLHPAHELSKSWFTGRQIWSWAQLPSLFSDRAQIDHKVPRA